MVSVTVCYLLAAIFHSPCRLFLLQGYHRCPLTSGGSMEWWWFPCRDSRWSCSSLRLPGLPVPSKQLPQLDSGDISSMSSLANLVLSPSFSCNPRCSPSCSWSLRSLAKKLIYFMARRRISFLLSFLSGGWVGISLRSSEKAPLTFCCLHLSLLFVKILRTILGCEPPGRIKNSRDFNQKSCQNVSNNTGKFGELH